MNASVPVPAATRARLRRLAAKYETEAFVADDPIRFLRSSSGPGVETTAFVAACLSYGSRTQFLPKIQEVVDLAGGDVHGWIASGRFARSFRAGDARSFYRLFSYGKMHCLFAALRPLLRRHGSLGEFLRASGATTAPEALCATLRGFRGQGRAHCPQGLLFCLQASLPLSALDGPRQLPGRLRPVERLVRQGVAHRPA